ncbi:MAG: hydratase [Defluviitaleaceae bacterium]|nr:hydratase [Defluviitaleaceae bacterium]MCL2262729.1 hydratase [Defluviitaleaceae bacterium]
MVNCRKEGIFVKNGREVLADGGGVSREEAAKNTMAYKVMAAHNTAGEGSGLWQLKFDALASHDITYVGVIQTVRAAEPNFEKFPVPYVLTNCHNSLCAVGGTTNSDDHAFGLSAAKKYGGVFVPPHIAVIHQYVREEIAAGGKMVLGSDSHTRYGALGTMGIGEGGGELVKQILGRTYDISRPEVIGVMLEGEPRPGVGPQDVALALIGAVFSDGFVKNKVLEFFGTGVAGLSMDFRMGVDVMTTETTCLSSIWETDGSVEEFYALHGRAGDFKQISPAETAYYDGLVTINLSEIVPMIAMPFHPSNVYKIEDVQKNAADILREVEKSADETAPLELSRLIEGKGMRVDQGIIAGCAGGLYESILGAADILKGKGVGMPLSVYPASQPMYDNLMGNGIASTLLRAGAVMKTAFCGPCFGAGDVPRNNSFSIRHVTRNFPSREGAKPAMNQSASVALMDALSIAATAANGGVLTAATDVMRENTKPIKYFFDEEIYRNSIYNGVGKPDKNAELVYGPGIRDWPKFLPLGEDMILQVASFITDPVTTTDELIPSGETSTFRSNPYALAEHTLSRKDPSYVARAKKSREWAETKTAPDYAELTAVFDALKSAGHSVSEKAAIGSVVYARKPGDGSAREQAASCQRVLGGLANIAQEYATKRYRSNLINWGMIPFILPGDAPFACEDFIYIPAIRAAIQNRDEKIHALVVSGGKVTPITLEISITAAESAALLAGCLINLYSC